MVTVALVGAMYYGAIMIFRMIWTHGNVHRDGIEEMIPQGSLRETDARPSFRKSGQTASIGERFAVERT